MTDFDITFTPLDGSAPFSFEREEVPEQLVLGGDQKLAVHELIGGGRIVDVLGQQPRRLNWDGVALGGLAQARMDSLNAYRISGTRLQLSFMTYSYVVVIRSFAYKLLKFYRFTYSIELEVIADNAATKPTAFPVTFDQQINTDVLAAVADGVAVPVLPQYVPQMDDINQNLSLMQQAQKAIGNFASATTGAINSVLGPIKDARDGIALLSGQIDNAIQNVTTVGGVLPNTPVANNSANLLNQIDQYNSQADLINLDGTVGRIQKNTETAPAAGQKIVDTVGGNLYQIAQQQYNDATLWTAIATANGLTDPQLASGQAYTLIIPPKPGGTGGVLNA